MDNPIVEPSVLSRHTYEPRDYEEMIADLQAILREDPTGASGCGICECETHLAVECPHNPLRMARLGRDKQWTYRCYHCGSVFRDERSAREHFGKTEDEVAKCIQRQAERSAGKARHGEEETDEPGGFRGS